MAKLQLRPLSWFGWLELPARNAGWAASPILITAVTPLKSGLGRLSLEFIQPLHPGGGISRSIVLTVGQHREGYLIGEFDDEGVQRAAIVSEISFAWLETYCVEHWRHRPAAAANWFVGDVALDEPKIEGHLARVFGEKPSNILVGTTASSFSVTGCALPAERAHLTVNQTYDAFDSWLIVRGLTPYEMEDKWFVYWRDGLLTLRRSWTGFVIYEVDAVWRDDRLYLGQARANREPDQYGETDDEFDRAMLLWVIDVVLLGKDAPFPTKVEDAGQAALAAWSVAGKASL
jgi:hypothetical protein